MYGSWCDVESWNGILLQKILWGDWSCLSIMVDRAGIEVFGLPGEN